LREADRLPIATQRNASRWLASTASTKPVLPMPSSTVGSQALDLPVREIMPFSAR